VLTSGSLILRKILRMDLSSQSEFRVKTSDFKLTDIATSIDLRRRRLVWWWLLQNSRRIWELTGSQQLIRTATGGPASELQPRRVGRMACLLEILHTCPARSVEHGQHVSTLHCSNINTLTSTTSLDVRAQLAKQW
jgi:hypothetical protein